MTKLNGSAKWIIIVVVVGGIVFSAGYAIKINTDNIQDVKQDLKEEVKDKELSKRITTLEANYQNIDKCLGRIERKLDGK